MKLEVDKRSLYRGHVLNFHPEVQDDGRFQARVAITCAGDDANVFQPHFSQRFLDLEVCETRELAIEKARQAGIAWVDGEWSSRSATPGSSPAPASS